MADIFLFTANLDQIKNY